MAKIGLMGGTFNPIHNAHLELARSAIKEFGLDQVLFMTGGNPPHKKGQSILDAGFRHRMVELALVGEEKLLPCDYEVKLSEYSYTANTLKHLHTQYPADEFYFILGADSLNYVENWYQPEVIFAHCVLLVYGRDGFDAKRDIAHLKDKFNADIRLIHAPTMALSSTQIRQAVQNGQAISAYVPAGVEAFIYKYDLYRADNLSWVAQLERRLKPKRFLHSLGVRDTAVKMAEQFGVDVQKAETAGLLHDCAKELDTDLALDMCRDLGIVLDRYEVENPGLIHAKLGAELVKYWFGVRDEEIVDAIRWHTLGKPEMSDLAKIIFVADMIEPARKYPEVEDLRRIAFSDLDRGLYACVDAVIGFNLEKGKIVHPNAYALRDWIKNQI